MSADGPNPPLEVERRRRSDPFRGMATQTILDVLQQRGWSDLAIRPEGGATLRLGRIVTVAWSSRDGERHLARLQGSHGALPATAQWVDSTGPVTRHVRAYLAPQTGVRTAEHLHGTAPGLTVRATGDEVLCNAASGGVPPFKIEGHPTTTPLAMLPEWFAEITRDPLAAERAQRTVTLSSGEKRQLAEWEQELTKSRGRPVNTFANLCTILRRAPEYAGRFAFSEMAQAPLFNGRGISDGDLGRLREAIERQYDLAAGADNLRGAIATVAEENRVNPVRDYLRALRWDGQARLDHVAHAVLGAEGDLPARMVRRWAISAVARALRPGCKVDTALVLVGAQGARKSTVFQVLAGEWFSDTHVDLASKDAFLQMAGAWVIEWGEIERVTSRKGADEIKAFLSSRVDSFRPPYGRSVVTVPRACVVVGSTNQSTFLEDDTGSRRFWIVRIPDGHTIDLDTLRQWRDQVWAEAVAALEAHEPWWFDAEEDREREGDAEQHQVEDPWLVPLRKWLGAQARTDHTAEEILSNAVDVPRKEQTKGNAMRLSRLMRSLGGWERRKVRPVRDGKAGEPTWCWCSTAPTQGQLGGDDDPFA